MSPASQQRKWRLVVSDLDGTLLDDQSSISPENAAAVAALAGSGIGFTIATGRMDRMVRIFVRQLDIMLPIIACNGAVIRDCQNNRIIWQQSLPADQSLALIRWLASHGYDYLCYTADLVYYPARSQRIGVFHHYNRQAAAAGESPISLLPLDGREATVSEQGLIKIITALPDQASLQAVRGQIAALPGCGGVFSTDGIFDIMAAGVSKGEALCRLAADLRINPADIVAIGDNDNDESMLAAAGLGIAMANATPAALAASQIVTLADHNQSGLAEAICRHVLQI
jgi:Cof subfamily protein (haloacid dehalogenase superfamily)